MSFLYRHLLRPLLFTQDSEGIHDRTLRALGWLGRTHWLRAGLAPFWKSPQLPVQLFGLHFPNPVGLAAGMDKRAEALPVWDLLGFGFSEMGGVTWHAQPGNPAPRMFRAVPDQALINRMGFNNPGAAALAGKLREWRVRGCWPHHPVGINLGKSKITPLENAADDYANSFRTLRDCADFFVVNVSSPNTPNLRQLQDKSALNEILVALQEIQRASVISDQCSVASGSASGETANEKKGERSDGTRTTHHAPQTKPILVKVAPDLSYEALDEILDLAGPRQVAGIVATNTTIVRPQTTSSQLAKIYAEPGGLSGRPLKARSTEVIRHLYRQTKGALPIIGVGGIFNADDAWEKITAGASLIQIYTGLVYEGPGLPKCIVTGLKTRVAALGNPSWPDVVGSASSL
jgi:dihydroorotate dehydrogenase